LGLAFGIGVAFLRERLDDRLRGRRDLEFHSGTSVLAIIPRVPGWKRRNSSVLVALSEPTSAAAESYRTLRIGVSFALSQHDVKTLIVTSPRAGEGKTTTTANLAAAFERAGKRVVVISGDLRKPRLEEFFGVKNTALGLTNVLAGEVALDEVLVRPEGFSNLLFLPSGPIPGNPSEPLSSPAVGKLLAELESKADLVLMDVPPVLVVSDALAVSRFMDGVLLVADAGSTSRSEVEQASMQLSRVNAHLIGAVLNNVHRSSSTASAHLYGPRHAYYSQSEDGSEERTRKFSLIRR
jgi:capsular exopolysaccharide synthesis family protein